MHTYILIKKLFTLNVHCGALYPRLIGPKGYVRISKFAAVLSTNLLVLSLKISEIDVFIQTDILNFFENSCKKQ